MDPNESKFFEAQTLILNKENSNENFIRFDLFCPINGKMTCLSRLTKKNTLPDLFDLTTLHLSRTKQGNLLFLKEFQVNHHHNDIPKNYNAFFCACEWSKILSLNLVHIDQPQNLFSLTRKAFNAFDQFPNPESAYFKTLYLFTRQEGYPTKEQWLNSLSTDLLNDALSILTNPLKLQTLHNSAVESLIELLHKWIREQTDIMLPTNTSSQI